jgi:hypothetical protein
MAWELGKCRCASWTIKQVQAAMPGFIFQNLTDYPFASLVTTDSIPADPVFKPINGDWSFRPKVVSAVYTTDYNDFGRLTQSTLNPDQITGPTSPNPTPVPTLSGPLATGSYDYFFNRVSGGVWVLTFTPGPSLSISVTTYGERFYGTYLGSSYRFYGIRSTVYSNPISDVLDSLCRQALADGGPFAPSTSTTIYCLVADDGYPRWSGVASGGIVPDPFLFQVHKSFRRPGTTPYTMSMSQMFIHNGGTHRVTGFDLGADSVAPGTALPCQNLLVLCGGGLIEAPSTPMWKKITMDTVCSI